MTYEEANRLLLEEPWVVKGTTIIVNPCPIGKKCSQGIPQIEGDTSTVHGFYGGHLICESINEVLARHMVDLHNACVPKGKP